MSSERLTGITDLGIIPFEDQLEDHGHCACRRKDSGGYTRTASKYEGRSHERGEIVLFDTTVQNQSQMVEAKNNSS